MLVEIPQWRNVMAETLACSRACYCCASLVYMCGRALHCPMCASPYAEFNKTAGTLWLGFAVLLFFALYPIILYKISLGHNQDGSRSFHWFIVAAPCVIAVAWHSVQTNASSLFIVLYLGSLALTAVLCYGIFPVRYAVSQVSCVRLCFCGWCRHATSSLTKDVIAHTQQYRSASTFT